jgi:hypothetical protein
VGTETLHMFSLMIPKIESIRGLEDFEFTKMLWRDMIQDSEFSPFRYFILGVQERRAQFEHGDHMVMIIGVKCQHEAIKTQLLVR